MSADLIFARQALSAFVLERAVAMSRQIGFSWVAVESGHPETYEELLTEYAHCVNTGRDFRVWSGGSEHTIYSQPSVNYAFRFWHDMIHAQQGYTMSYRDEVSLGEYHCQHVGKRFGFDSLEYKLMLADTIGQSTHERLTGKFPDNQIAFALKLMEYKA